MFTLAWLMQTATNDERRLSKTEVEAESYVNESENPMDFGFAKNCRNPTTFDSNSVTSVLLGAN